MTVSCLVIRYICHGGVTVRFMAYATSFMFVTAPQCYNNRKAKYNISTRTNASINRSNSQLTADVHVTFLYHVVHGGASVWLKGCLYLFVCGRFVYPGCLLSSLLWLVRAECNQLLPVLLLCTCMIE